MGLFMKRFVLPISIFCPVERGAGALRVNVPHVIASPRSRRRLVLVRSQSPFRSAGHWIDRHLSQKPDLCTGRAHDVCGNESILEYLEVLWITALGFQLDWN